MKVVLLQHVKGLGQKGEIKEVSDGYFRNALAPRQLAKLATSGQVKHVRAQQAKSLEKLQNMKESALSLKSKLEGKTIQLTEKASESGKLYASVSNKEVAQAIKAQLKVELPVKKISLETIKETGDFPVQIQLYKDIRAQLTLHITAA